MGVIVMVIPYNTLGQIAALVFSIDAPLKEVLLGDAGKPTPVSRSACVVLTLRVVNGCC